MLILIEGLESHYLETVLSSHGAFPEKEGRTYCGRYPWANLSRAMKRFHLTYCRCDLSTVTLTVFSSHAVDPEEQGRRRCPVLIHRLTPTFRHSLIVEAYPSHPGGSEAAPRRSVNHAIFSR